MAGRGPARKPASRRARTNRDDVVVVRLVQAGQPDLPDDVPWPELTRQWWRMWGESPRAEQWDAVTWHELMMTAYIHAEFVSGNFDRAAELRIRMAKFGATPEDMARLRIVLAEADEKDRRKSGPEKPQSRFAHLKAVES